MKVWSMLTGVIGGVSGVTVGSILLPGIRKVICALAYLFGILFFLPLVMYPNDEFAKFHANQALVVLLVVVIGEMILGILNIIPVVGFIFGILCGVFGLLMLIACIFAILGVVREEKFELPVIGKIKILK